MDIMPDSRISRSADSAIGFSFFEKYINNFNFFDKKDKSFATFCAMVFAGRSYFEKILQTRNN